MLSPIRTTGQLLRGRQRQSKLELALVLMNVAAYAFAVANFVGGLA